MPEIYPNIFSKVGEDTKKIIAHSYEGDIDAFIIMQESLIYQFDSLPDPDTNILVYESKEESQKLVKRLFPRIFIDRTKRILGYDYLGLLTQRSMYYLSKGDMDKIGLDYATSLFRFNIETAALSNVYDIGKRSFPYKQINRFLESCFPGISGMSEEDIVDVMTRVANHLKGQKSDKLQPYSDFINFRG